MRYERLYSRRKECIELHKKTNNLEYFMEEDCIEHFYECEGYKKYEKILEFAKQNNFKRVFDIGCAYGHQSEVFLDSGIEYIGINEHECNYWNKDRFKYISGRYPFKIDARSDDLAVSVLCLTWNIYLHEGDKTLREQCEALQRDFKNCMIHMDSEKIDYVKKFFKDYKLLDGKFAYFSNQLL